MFWMFRKKSPTQKALGWLQRQCRDAQPADLIGAGLVIDVLHVGFSKEFGNVSEFCKRPCSEQGEYMRRIADLQDQGEAKLGTDLFGLWVIAAQIGDATTHVKAAEIMARLSRLANGAKP